MIKNILLFLTISLVASPVYSQILDPVKWTFESKKTGSDTYTLTFTAKIQEEWTIYSQFLESQDGPTATLFEFDKGKHYQLIGKAEENPLNRKKIFDEVFEMNVVKFYKKAIFTQKLRILDDSKPVTGLVNFMTCNKEMCLPPKDVEFSFQLKSDVAAIIPAETSVANATDATSKIDTATTIAGNIESKAPATVKLADCSAHKLEGNVLDQQIPSIVASYAKPIGDCGVEDVTRDLGLFWTFLFGFLGGLIALLTPCVFPMIPLTVSFFTKGSKDRKSGIKNGLIYGASIVIIYVAIGLIITALFGATALNALSTNWIANTLFFLIFLFFAFSFFGYYEITLPSWISNKSDAMADQGGLIGTFFMAFTLAIVSFSCTGPIIGSALVESADNVMGPFIVMLGFSIALALPFGLFAAFPAWLNSLPKSGSWMTTVKVVLGFLELALAFKFLSVADMTSHWGILKYETFMAIWVILFAGMALYLFGFIRFPHDNPNEKIGPKRKVFGGLIVVWTLYLISGFFFNATTNSYDSKLLLSGLAPPAHYNIFLKEGTVDPKIKSRYPSFTKTANNLDCFKDYCEGMSYAKEVGKPVLLDFTGYGCVNCRKTEEHIWVAEKVRKLISEKYVLISLYVDDKRKLDEILYSKSRKEKLRDVGDVYADLQIVNFKQNTQPLYVLLSPDEQVMSKPRGYKEGVDAYAEYLECGLNVFLEKK